MEPSGDTGWLDSSHNSLPLVYFSALNAGYSDTNSSQNYDFFELAKNTDSPIEVSSLSVKYFNSVNNLSGEILLSDNLIWRDGRLVFGSEKSPQYQDFSGSPYTYNFNSTGLASTSGTLRLYLGEELIDEVCWGKNTCNEQNDSFFYEVGG